MIESNYTTTSVVYSPLTMSKQIDYWSVYWGSLLREITGEFTMVVY